MNLLFSKLLYFVFAFLLLFLITGCKSTTGDKRIRDTTLTQQIQPEVSTKEDVRALIGSPTNVSFSDGNEVWQYIYKEETLRGQSLIPIAGMFIGGVDVEVDNVTILFDENDIVQRGFLAVSCG